MMKMMRLANSSSYFKLEKLKTPRQAILLLGRLQLSRLVQILLFMSDNDGSCQDDPLVQTAIVRGRLIEELLEFNRETALKPYGFMLGMLSMAGVLFGVETEDIVKIMEFDEVVASALLRRAGRLGEFLALAEAAERATTPESIQALEVTLEELNICPASSFNRMQVDALRWAGQM